MDIKLNEIVTKIKNSWDTMDIESFNEIQTLIGKLALSGIDKNRDYSEKGIELYRDKELGFILTVYSETRGIYRIPHNHGNGWVIYSVVKGAVEMGNYINWIRSTDQSQLILKNKIKLEDGDTKKYFPQDIHDTKCLSENAIILRLTSCDLKVEENVGRMRRFNFSKV